MLIVEMRFLGKGVKWRKKGKPEQLVVFLFELDSIATDMTSLIV